MEPLLSPTISVDTLCRSPDRWFDAVTAAWHSLKVIVAEQRRPSRRRPIYFTKPRLRNFASRERLMVGGGVSKHARSNVCPRR
jgi:hypothetical protein